MPISKEVEKELHDMMMGHYDQGIDDCKEIIIQGLESVKNKGVESLTIDQIIDIIKNTENTNKS